MINNTDFTPQKSVLDSIWIQGGIIHSFGKSVCKFSPGDDIRIENGLMVGHDNESPVTHKIIKCYESMPLSLDHLMSVLDLNTRQITEWKLNYSKKEDSIFGRHEKIY